MPEEKTEGELSAKPQGLFTEGTFLIGLIPCESA